MSWESGGWNNSNANEFGAPVAAEPVNEFANGGDDNGEAAAGGDAFGAGGNDGACYNCGESGYVQFVATILIHLG